MDAHSAPASPPALAKLSRPRLFDVVPRERLFTTLDAARGHPVVWLEGPPGAGKTALVASYLEARALPGVWYQVDAGDADVATLFYYLARSRDLADAAAPLPLLAPEFAADLPGFARRYFRELYARLRTPAVLVLDNFHEAAHNPSFVAAMREALAEVPAGVHVFVLSRSGPPPEFSRLRTTGAIAVIDWPTLQMTVDETAAIAGLDVDVDRAQCATLHDACGGWAAGLTLMLTYGGNAASGCRSREAMFDFFAAEILDRSEPATRDFLLRTWVLPRMTPTLVATLTGSVDAAAILDGLHRRNYFTERRLDPELGYQYHAMFRSFLEARARQVRTPAEIARLQGDAARSLEAEGSGDEAVSLWLAAGANAAAARLILARAAQLAVDGRLETLGAWLRALPDASAETEPALHHWQGVCQLGHDPGAARAAFAHAYRLFERRGDVAGSIRAATGVIESYYVEWSDFTPLDPWIDALCRLFAQDPAFATPADELQAVAGVMVAMLYRQPGHALLPEFVARTRALLEQALPPDLRLAAATFLLNVHNWTGDTTAAREVVTLAQPLLAAAEPRPLHRAWWLVRLAYHHYIVGEPAATVHTLAAAQALASEHGFAVVETIALLYELFHHLSQADADAAGAVIGKLELRLDPARRFDVAIATYLKAWHALLRGERDLAQTLGAEAAQRAERAGVPNVHGYFLMLVAYSAGERGDHAAALAAWDRGWRRTSPERYRLFAYEAKLLRAHLAERAGEPAAARAALAEAFALGVDGQYSNDLLWLPEMMSKLCARALAAGIEPDYAQRLIRQRRLPPPRIDAPDWPWPLRLRTLGSFAVERHGTPLRFSGKAQKKPLAMLMALVAFGGRDVAPGRLAQALWPDAEGDAARSALGTTLFRLRHLLEADDAVRLEDGKLALDPRQVWVDVWAFERLATQVETAAGPDPETAAQLLRLYAGHFLGREDDEPWMLSTRERLRYSFVHTVERLGTRMEDAGRVDEAMRLYRHALDLDALAETLYRRLMLCLVAQQRRAEAIEVYRSCRQTLSVVLGVKPSPETEAARRALG